jgi:N-acetyl-anhydromuramyl-L-alanine amidase AmpD
MAALEKLARDILKRHLIPPRNVVAHSDVAPERKEDPGELFDWAHLSRAGIGLWPNGHGTQGATFQQGDRDKAIADAQTKLAAWGYEVPTNGVLDARTARVLVAFQRHFRPARFDGTLDGETVACLDALLAAAGG